MKKGYWVGQVKEIKNEEKWGQYLEKFMNIVAEEAEKKSGNFVFTAGSEPKHYVQKNFDLLFFHHQKFLRFVKESYHWVAIDIANSHESSYSLISRYSSKLWGL